MATARPVGLTDLAKYGFADLSSTVGKLESLVKLVGDSGHSALAYLSATADPDQALNALLGFAELDRAEIKKLLQREETGEKLVRLLGASTALGDFMRRYPKMLENLGKGVAQLPLPSQMASSLSAAVAEYPAQMSLDQAWSALRIAYRVELCKIAVYDLMAIESQLVLPQVAEALAELAGASINAAIQIARQELVYTTDHGQFSSEEVAATRFSVIAMGKCGAKELNYISDVDVIFVSEPADETITVQRCLEIATKLATRMMRAIDGNASEPMLWQVDPNLRPEGKSGALVRTLDSHLAYYDRWAESWEFQALLKARPLAGDMSLGEAYVEALWPKVWASTTRPNFVESVQKMRKRVTDNIPASEVDRQIKLGPGGLRDIEFTVQLLQLVHGRQDTSLRVRDTLSAIEALADGGYIGRSEASSFSRNYRFLRLLEHRIQLSNLRRTHLMPVSETALRALARSVDTKLTSAGLIERWEAVKVEVRSLHQKLFYRPLLTAVSKLEDSQLELSSEQAIERLSAIGFSDPGGALNHIRALTSGLSRRASIQKQLLPVLLEWFSDGSDPDSALLAFRRLSEDLGDSPWYLRMLRDSSGAAKRLTQVLSSSRLATNLFEKIPEAAAWFDDTDNLKPLTFKEIVAGADVVISRHDSADAASAGVRAIRRRETLRIAMGAVLGELTITDVSEGLSALTEAYLVSLLSVVEKLAAPNLWRSNLSEVVDFGIVAMGRFGGSELGFGSDADIMFVYNPVQQDRSDEAQKAAERIIAELKRLSADPILEFEIDLDLRPEGKNGAVARSLDSYRAYYERWADTWESQALIRARPIAGSQSLMRDFTVLIDRYRYPEQLTEQQITEIRRIKARVETERLPQGADPKRHLKLGRGSLSDVEWLVQLLQLKYGRQHPSIQSARTLESLEACVKVGLIAEHDARVLSEAWTLASRVRSASVLWANKRSDVLPTDRNQLEGMARILEYPRFSATALEQDYMSFTRRARRVFERLFYGWSSEDSGD
jgi:glutamate-ammonia-ligase adenylyltransferase